MKWYTASILLLVLAAGLSYAGQRNPTPRPKPQPVVALLILENPGKDGTIWSVGFDLQSQAENPADCRTKVGQSSCP